MGRKFWRSSSGCSCPGKVRGAGSTSPAPQLEFKFLPPSLFHVAGQAVSITIINGRVYIGGFCRSGTDYIPCYWIDGMRFDLSIVAGGLETRVTSLYIR
jgi:hypothetical protein